MKRKKILRVLTPIFIIVGGIVGLMVMFAAKPEPERTTGEPRPVTLFVDEVTQSAIPLTIETQGEVRSKTEIQIVPQVSGRIISVSDSYTAGGKFSANEALVKIDDSSYRATVTRVEAQVAAARLNLLQMEGAAEVARKQWDESVAGEASPLALKQPHVEDARARLRSAEADLAEARLNLERTNVSIPFDGRVQEKLADVGQFVTQGTPLAKVFSTEVAQIRLPVTDSQLSALGLPLAYEANSHDAMDVKLSTTLAGKYREWIGHVVRTDAMIDSTTRMVFITAEVDDPYGAGADGDMPLAVGLFVNATIEGEMVEQANVIPRLALRGVDKVYVVDDEGTLEIRQVEVRFTDADKAVIDSGLAPGEQVVVSAVRAPYNGMKVQALRRGANQTYAQISE